MPPRRGPRRYHRYNYQSAWGGVDVCAVRRCECLYGAVYLGGDVVGTEGEAEEEGGGVGERRRELGGGR